MDAAKRRRIVEMIAASEGASLSDRLRALELLERLDGRPEADPDYEMWQMFRAMTDEELDRELVALGVPVTTLPPPPDEDLLAQPGALRRLRELAEEETRKLREQMWELRARLREAEAKLGAPESASATRSAAGDGYAASCSWSAVPGCALFVARGNGHSE